MTVCEGRVYVTFTENSRDGIRGCIAVTDDFEKYEILSMSAPDNRNMIIFPEKVEGKFVRLERPFRAYGMRGDDKYDTWFSDSPDCRYWGNTHLVLRANDLPFCNWKNGPSGQPIKTDKGWLTVFHATHYDPDTEYPTWRSENWHKLYCAGIMMLDLEEPWKIVGISQDPLMVPEEPYETDGFRSYTLFPSATLLEDDGTVRIYYGACDTVLALATAKLDDLIDLCKPV
jgi:beta-1,4-mannooligosaccharide/beta-1,4-mannosyl-N-acetylglucosamine phosphorylase